MTGWYMPQVVELGSVVEVFPLVGSDNYRIYRIYL